MIEVLPIRLLTDEDIPIFGSLAQALGKLERAGLPVCPGIAATAPQFKLKTILERFDFKNHEVYEQSLTLAKKEISKMSPPQILVKETAGHKDFLFDGLIIKSVKNLWQAMLSSWLSEIKDRIWNRGFYEGITEGLGTEIIIFIKKLKGQGRAYFDEFEDDVFIKVVSGKPAHKDFQKIKEFVREADKKLFIPHAYEWIIDRGVKIYGVLPHPPQVWDSLTPPVCKARPCEAQQSKSAVKVFFDLSQGFTIEKNIDGVYIASEKIFDLNKPQNSFDEMLFKLVEGAITFPNSPVLFKLADKSEGMGKVRGSLRLLHQKSLLNPMLSALDFARHKKNLTNVHVVIPYVRGVNELLQIKRELAVRKLMRKNSLQMWLEIAVPENIINLEDYLVAGIDGVVLNLDELIAHLNGFDPKESELSFYKNEADGLIKFLEDGIRLLHKSKIPFIACGSLTFYPKVLEFLVEKGVYGIVAEKYEAHSAYDFLHQMERRIILRRV